MLGSNALQDVPCGTWHGPQHPDRLQAFSRPGIQRADAAGTALLSVSGGVRCGRPASRKPAARMPSQGPAPQPRHAVPCDAVLLHCAQHHATITTTATTSMLALPAPSVALTLPGYAPAPPASRR